MLARRDLRGLYSVQATTRKSAVGCHLSGLCCVDVFISMALFFMNPFGCNLLVNVNHVVLGMFFTFTGCYLDRLRDSHVVST